MVLGLFQSWPVGFTERRHSEKKECYILRVVTSGGQLSRLHSAVSFSGVAGSRTISNVFGDQERKGRLIWKLLEDT